MDHLEMALVGSHPVCALNWHSLFSSCEKQKAFQFGFKIW